MERAFAPLLLVALGTLLARAVWRLAEATKRRREARAAILNPALPLLADHRVRIQPDGFPRLGGTFAGARVDLRLVSDTLTTRKLPALWCLATLTEPQPVAATWHLMLRPRGTETFSAHVDLPSALPLPPELPTDASLRADGGAGSPPAPVLRAMAGAVARLGEARLKEVVLSPKGLRLTWLAEEADRGRYLIFRDSEMGAEPLGAATVEALLRELVTIRDALAREPVRLRA